MILESIKVLRISKSTGLMFEELFLLQTISDYQHYTEDFNLEFLKELEEGYLSYYSVFSKSYDPGGDFECSIPWKNMVNKLIRDGWLEDYRKTKESFKLSELKVSDKFKEIFMGSKTDEELFEIAKEIYPKNYKNQYGTIAPNFNMSVKEEQELFKAFKKKILGGNRKENWNKFYWITNEFYENTDYISEKRFDRYINTFPENIKSYEKFIKESL